MVTGAGPFLDRIHREIARRVGRDRIEELLVLLDELERALSEPSNERPAERKNRRKQQP